MSVPRPIASPLARQFRSLTDSATSPAPREVRVERAFVKIPYRAMELARMDSRLGPSLYLVYSVLYAQSWGWRRPWCRLSLPDLESRSGLGRNGLRAAVRVLQGIGWISIGATTQEGTLYTVHVPRESFDGDPPAWAPLVEAVQLDQEEPAAPAPLVEAVQLDQEEPAAPAPLVEAVGSSSDPRGVQFRPQGGPVQTPHSTDLDLDQGTEHTPRAREVCPSPRVDDLPWVLTIWQIGALCKAWGSEAVGRAVLTVWATYQGHCRDVRRPAALLRACLAGRADWPLLTDKQIAAWVDTAACTALHTATDAQASRLAALALRCRRGGITLAEMLRAGEQIVPPAEGCRSGLYALLWQVRP